MENTTNQTTATQEPTKDEEGITRTRLVTDQNNPAIKEYVAAVQKGMPADHVISRDPQQLLNALYWIWDAFERTNMPFFLVHQTAKDVIANKDLTGLDVQVGVRKMEWISGGRRILDAFITPKEENETQALYVFEGVPVIVHIYEDSDCIINTDMKRYRYEAFKVPNPYSEFEKLYD